MISLQLSNYFSLNLWLFSLKEKTSLIIFLFLDLDQPKRKIIKKYHVHFFGNFSIEQGLKVVILSLISWNMFPFLTNRAKPHFKSTGREGLKKTGQERSISTLSLLNYCELIVSFDFDFESENLEENKRTWFIENERKINDNEFS